MNERFNQSSHPARTGDHPLPRRGDPNFSTSHPYSSSAHPQPQAHPNYTTLPGAYPQQMQPRRYDDPHNGSQYVSPNHSHPCKSRSRNFFSLLIKLFELLLTSNKQDPQQRHPAAGYSNREALQLPQMDSDLSGLTRDLQNVHVSSSPQPAQAVSPVTGHHSPPGRSIPRKPVGAR